jgi:glyoxylase-like metal-dependent hydrolase (beta-lactamase superfamily II)
MTLKRREFLLTGLAARYLYAQQTPAPVLFDRGFARVTEFAPGVWVTIAELSRLECASNGGVIAGRDAVLIIEGHMQREGAALEIETARKVSKAPIRGAVNTHFHMDHTFGNIAYAEQHIPILAHEKTVVLMKEQYASVKGADKSSLLEPLKKKVAQAADELDRQRKEEDLKSFQWMFDAIDRATLAFPTETLTAGDTPKRIDLGGLTATIEYQPGHTPTDLVVRVPERELVFTGDLLFHDAYPVAPDADMIAWRKVLDRFAGYSRKTRFVPGHGPICGHETVRNQAALFDDLHTHAEKMLRAGTTADEAERRYVVPARFQSYHVHSRALTIGAAMRSYFQKRARG